MNATMWLIAGALSFLFGGAAAAVTIRTNEYPGHSVGALRRKIFAVAVAVSSVGFIALAGFLVFGELSPGILGIEKTIALATFGAIVLGNSLNTLASSNDWQAGAHTHNEQDTNE
jgi:hypothetical protein